MVAIELIGKAIDTPHIPSVSSPYNFPSVNSSHLELRRGWLKETFVLVNGSFSPVFFALPEIFVHNNQIKNCFLFCFILTYLYLCSE